MAMIDEVTLEENIIYDKLTGKIPVYGSKTNAAELNSADSASKNSLVRSKEEQIAQYMEELSQRLDTMEATRENLAFRPIFSCRKFIGRMIVFIKRVVRKCLKWYLEPVCFQQTEFNNAVTPAIGRLTELQHYLRNDLAALAESYTALLDALEKMEQKSSEQEEKLRQYEQMIQKHAQCIGLLTVEHNGRLDAIEMHFSELKEHNGRLDAIETHFSELKEYYGFRLDAAEKLFQELEDDGVFLSARKELPLHRSSTSQSGEDTILAYIFMVLGIAESECTYLDLGANHAKKFSNTYYFYQKGSRGVLVEANPKLISELKFYRSGDVVINRCIAEKSGQSIDFYILNGDGLSTPDRKQAEKDMAYNPALQIEDIVPVRTITVNEILDTYFDGAPVFLNMDVEGAEMEILKSIDFEAHRPLAIVIEMIPYRSHLVVGIKNQEILQFMSDVDYVEYAFTGINSIFLDKKKIRNMGVLE